VKSATQTEKESLESEVIRVLLMEDNPGDFRLIREALSEVDGASFHVEQVDRLSTGLERLAENETDVVLLDLSLPDAKGLAGLVQTRAAAQHLPIVVLTGLEDDALGLEAVRTGAHDYLVKGTLSSNSLARVLRYAVERQRMLAELENHTQELEARESNYRSVISNNADGMIVVDKNGIVHFVNPAAERLFGREREELLGQLFGFPVVPGEQTEVDIIRSDNELTVAEMRVVETVWEGRPSLLATLRDVTERMRASALLEASEQRYRDLYEEAPVSFWGVGIDERVIRANRRAQELLGYERQTLVGMNVFDLYANSPAGKDKAKELFERFQSGEEFHDEELEMQRSDGETVWVSLSAKPITDELKRVTESR